MENQVINDEYIINTFFVDGVYNYRKLRKTWLNKNIEIYNYLINKYNDSKSLSETIYRIKYGIHIKPKCKICGGEVKFNKKYKSLFNIYCSSKCSMNDPEVQIKRIETSKLKYGENNYNNRLKCKETCLEKYGVDNIAKSELCKEKYKQTCLEKYGVDNSFKVKDIISKIRTKKEKTCLEKYGVKNVSQVKEIQEQICKHRIENNLKKYGVKFVKQLDWVKEKEIETKRRNHTFNTSKTETESYKLLKEKYTNVEYQYRSELYPFACDFYIPELDLYIECNYHWTHGGHPFNENNLEDQEKLKLWESKNTRFYDNAINCWTIRDVNKRNKAKENNLNYLEFWHINELKEWLNS